MKNRKEESTIGKDERVSHITDADENIVLTIASVPRQHTSDLDRCMGWSIVSKDDMPCRRLGRSISLGRARCLAKTEMLQGNCTFACSNEIQVIIKRLRKTELNGKKTKGFFRKLVRDMKRGCVTDEA